MRFYEVCQRFRALRTLGNEPVAIFFFTTENCSYSVWWHVRALKRNTREIFHSMFHSFFLFVSSFFVLRFPRGETEIWPVSLACLFGLSLVCRRIPQFCKNFSFISSRTHQPLVTGVGDHYLKGTMSSFVAWFWKSQRDIFIIESWTLVVLFCKAVMEKWLKCIRSEDG